MIRFTRFTLSRTPCTIQFLHTLYKNFGCDNVIDIITFQKLMPYICKVMKVDFTDLAVVQIQQASALFVF